MKFFLAIFLALMVGFGGFAQQVKQAKLPLGFEWATENLAPGIAVHCFVKGDHIQITSFVQQNGGIVKYAFKGYLAVLLARESVVLLANKDFVSHIHFEHHPGQPLLSSSRLHTGVERVHSDDAGLPTALKGSGVIVGIIDAGIELEHPDFQYPDGSTRVIELWDQTMVYSALRTPVYGYGQVWDSAEINAGLCPHADQSIWFGHGTNTAGIAAGNGSTNSGYTGIAPESELIVVSSNFNAIGWTYTVADAVNYIFSRAEALGKPCVINASIGTYLGSHDARDFAAQLIDEDITAAHGRIMVCAAGNAGNQAPFHLGYNASADTNFTWFATQPGAIVGQGSIRFEFFGDVGNMEHLQFAVGADQVTPTFSFRGSTDFDSIPNRLNVVYTDSLFSISGNFLAEVITYADSINGTYRMQVQIEPIDSVAYRYRFSVTGEGRFDLWSSSWLGLRDMLYQSLPTPSQFQDMVNYKLPDIDQSIVSSWACSDKVITVGNMINRSSYVDVDNLSVVLTGQIAGSIAPSSSYGPARTGVLKPDVTAPGDNTLTAGAFFQLNNLLNTPSQRNRVGVGGLHHRAGGTSSASPVVAGIGALYLELCAEGDWSGFKTALNSNTFAEDNFTGQLPNSRWGNGKTNAVSALRYGSPKPALLYEDNEFCDGSAMEVSLAQAYPAMAWNTNDSGISVMVEATGQYFATVVDENGCVGISDTVMLFKRPNPDQPIVDVETALPACPNESVMLSVDDVYGAYEWSNGAFTSSIQVTEAGVYTCEVFNIFLCSSISEPVQVSFFPEMPMPELHFKHGDILQLVVDSALVSSYLWIINGEEKPIYASQSSIPAEIGLVEAGYFDTNACLHMAEGLGVYALGMSGVETSSISVFPNPVRETLYLNNLNNFKFWSLRSAKGELIAEGAMQSGLNQLDFSSFAAGVYVLKLSDQMGSQQSLKVVK